MVRMRQWLARRYVFGHFEQLLTELHMEDIKGHTNVKKITPDFLEAKGGGPRVVVSTAAFHARVRGSVPGLGGLKETKIVSSPSTCES